MADSYLTAIVNGVETKLTALPGVSGWPIVKGPTNQAPDKSIIIHPYIVESDDLTTKEFVYAVQIRIRNKAGTAAKTVFDLQDEVFLALNNLEYADFGGVTVALTWRQTSAILGLDAQGRPEAADSYYMRGNR